MSSGDKGWKDEQLAELQRSLEREEPTLGEDDSSRRPSTGQPTDYLIVEDFSDKPRGLVVNIATGRMPLEAEDAYKLWRQSRASKALEQYIPGYADEFERIMGFSPTSLEESAKELLRKTTEVR